MGKMFPPAETDLEPAPRTSCGQRLGNVNGNPGQEFIHQLRMQTAQGFPFAPSVKLVDWYGRCHFAAMAFLSLATRSVFSQEKPPSLSGLRPKWP